MPSEGDGPLNNPYCRDLTLVDNASAYTGRDVVFRTGSLVNVSPLIRPSDFDSYSSFDFLLRWLQILGGSVAVVHQSDFDSYSSFDSYICYLQSLGVLVGVVDSSDSHSYSRFISYICHLRSVAVPVAVIKRRTSVPILYNSNNYENRGSSTGIGTGIYYGYSTGMERGMYYGASAGMEGYGRNNRNSHNYYEDCDPNGSSTGMGTGIHYGYPTGMERGIYYGASTGMEVYGWNNRNNHNYYEGRDPNNDENHGSSTGMDIYYGSSTGASTGMERYGWNNHEAYLYETFYYEEEEISVRDQRVVEEIDLGYGNCTLLVQRNEIVPDYKDADKTFDTCIPLRELQELINSEPISDRATIMKKVNLTGTLMASEEIVVLSNRNIEALLYLKSRGWEGRVRIPEFLGRQQRDFILECLDNRFEVRLD